MRPGRVIVSSMDSADLYRKHIDAERFPRVLAFIQALPSKSGSRFLSWAIGIPDRHPGVPLAPEFVDELVDWMATVPTREQGRAAILRAPDRGGPRSR